jgi:hypothetical protein
MHKSHPPSLSHTTHTHTQAHILYLSFYIYVISAAKLLYINQSLFNFAVVFESKTKIKQKLKKFNSLGERKFLFPFFERF